MASCGFGEDVAPDSCVRVVKNFKTVQVPCTRNSYKQYTVKVPRQVTEQVPRTIHYTDYESCPKQIPYTVNRQERRTRCQTQKYQVPVRTQKIRMVSVTKKVPKIVYVEVTTKVPQQYSTTIMQTRERQVPEEYWVNVPETKWRTCTEQVPVQKTKVEMDTVTKTVYDEQVRTKCVPETKIISKQIPVYNVVATPSKPCGLYADCGGVPIDGAAKDDFNRIYNNADVNFNNIDIGYDVSNVNKESNYTRAAGNYDEQTCAKCF